MWPLGKPLLVTMGVELPQSSLPFKSTRLMAQQRKRGAPSETRRESIAVRGVLEPPRSLVSRPSRYLSEDRDFALRAWGSRCSER